MKFVKFAAFALTMGMFIASCGNGETKETSTVDSTTITTPAPAMDTTPAPAAAPVDTAMKADTTTKTTTTTTETK